MTTSHLAAYFQKPTGKHVQKTLTILLDQGFIGRRYEASYKLRLMPAVYYILPKGIHHLELGEEEQAMGAALVRSRYKDSVLSDQFVTRCLSIFDIFLYFESHHKGTYQIFTRSHFVLDTFEDLPRPLPDALIHITTGSYDRTILVLVFLQYDPPFVIRKTVRHFQEHIYEYDCFGDDNPLVLAVFETDEQELRASRYIMRIQDDDATWATTTMSQLKRDKGAYILSPAVRVGTSTRINKPLVSRTSIHQLLG